MMGKSGLQSARFHFEVQLLVSTSVCYNSCQLATAFITINEAQCCRRKWSEQRRSCSTCRLKCDESAMQSSNVAREDASITCSWSQRRSGSFASAGGRFSLCSCFHLRSKLIAIACLEPRYTYSGWHLEFLQDFSVCESIRLYSLSSPFHVACQNSPSTSDADDEAVRLDRAKNFSRLRMDLVNLPFLILTSAPWPAQIPSLGRRRRSPLSRC